MQLAIEKAREGVTQGQSPYGMDLSAYGERKSGVQKRAILSFSPTTSLEVMSIYTVSNQ